MPLTKRNFVMDRRQALLGTLCTAAAIALLPLPTEPLDVCMGLEGEARTALKRIIYSRVYGAVPQTQLRMGGAYVFSPEVITEAERRLFLANGYPKVTQKTRWAFHRHLMATA